MVTVTVTVVVIVSVMNVREKENMPIASEKKRTYWLKYRSRVGCGCDLSHYRQQIKTAKKRVVVHGPRNSKHRTRPQGHLLAEMKWEQWDRSYAAVFSFKNKHGHLQLPSCSNRETRRLLTWLGRQPEETTWNAQLPKRKVDRVNGGIQCQSTTTTRRERKGSMGQNVQHVTGTP
jgi:hypothetical protein